MTNKETSGWELKTEFIHIWKNKYWGKDFEGYPNYLPEGAIEEIADWWLEKLLSTKEQARQSALEEAAKIVENSEYDENYLEPSFTRKQERKRIIQALSSLSKKEI